MRRQSRTGLAERLRALSAAEQAAAGRVDPALVEEAQRVVRRAGQRLRFSGEVTVAALAGATGSGKSSLFNALAGVDVAAPGIRRPTTSQPSAVTWGPEPTEELLDWLQVTRRHHLAADGDAQALRGTVLLDLPDHDSVEVAHRMEVDRLVQLVDMLIWVVDPQKYADAALHSNYLVPLREYAPVMMVVLNQIDRLTDDERRRTLADLRALLDREGLQPVVIHAASARTGEGVPELRALLARRVSDKKTVAERTRLDVQGIATRLREACGTATAPKVGRASIDELDRACARAAGVPAVTEAVGQSWRRRGRLATGWPLVSWIASLRPDPLRRLHLDLAPRRRTRREIESGIDTRHAPTELATSSLRSMRAIPAAQVDSALRALADEASSGLTPGWTEAVRNAARSRTADLADELDRAIGSTNLQMHRNRRWWSVVRVVQWVLIATVVAGLGWLAVDFALLYLQMPPLPRILWFGIPVPTVLVAGGALGGLVLGGLSRIGVEVGARRKVVTARRALLGKIDTVTRELVITPVTEELERYEDAQQNLRVAAE
ncbi:50S ribosome-binding GTPase [Raineyella antarctica]|uniref:50S ribosome-binding GTPase n=1 Tax=Raineyella antarctica TaxID=1577474 RepID=A0A1G6H2J4_9ACTN|nr:GTPase [Raineyella antarctica]SDB88517.1 50S ribosome-binding GTPase [Raineyella antarctica]